jgi:cellulose binding protein with CBM3 domain/fibronectin type III domain protein
MRAVAALILGLALAVSLAAGAAAEGLVPPARSFVTHRLSALDLVPPTAPGAPAAARVGTTEVALTWPPAADDVAVASYDVYVQDTDFVYKAGTTQAPAFTVDSLRRAAAYLFFVRARDAGGNHSAQSPALSVVTAQRPGGPAYAVRYLNLDWSSAPDRIDLSVVLLNAGSTPVPLAGLTMRYWFTSESGTRRVDSECEGAWIGCSRVTRRLVPLMHPRPDADSYLEIGFAPGAGELAGNQLTGSIQMRIRRADGSAFNESNDYSWGPLSPYYVDNNRVTVYAGGVLVAGAEP